MAQSATATMTRADIDVQCPSDGLIPADKVAASYDPEQKVLALYAEGKVKKYTSGIRFVRDIHFVGGLKFDLEGWSGPIGRGW
jgi:hypothetical protein